MINIHLTTEGNILLGRVIKQSEEYRANSKQYPVILYENLEEDIRIVSRDCPYLTKNTLYIRGVDSEKDSIGFCYCYNSEEEAEHYEQLFRKAIAEINASSEVLWFPKREKGQLQCPCYYYYALDSLNDFQISKTYYRGDYGDRRNIEYSDMFPTRESAEIVVNSVIFNNIVWRIKFNLCPDIENKEYNTLVMYNRYNKEWVKHTTNNRGQFLPWFDKKSADKAVEYLNTHKELWEEYVR